MKKKLEKRVKMDFVGCIQFVSTMSGVLRHTLEQQPRAAK